jgi:hypothetical protein
MADETEVGCRPRPEPDPAPADLVRQQTPLSRLPGAEAKAITQANLVVITRHIFQGETMNVGSDTRRREQRESRRGQDDAAVMDKDNKYEFPSTLLSRHPEDVYMLLGIDRL